MQKLIDQLQHHANEAKKAVDEQQQVCGYICE